jgi:hypothetical protein
MIEDGVSTIDKNVYNQSKSVGKTANTMRKPII